MFSGTNRPTVKALFISPHFDDAVLSSCQPLIKYTHAKQPVLLLTIFTQAQDHTISADARTFIRSSHARSATRLFQQRAHEDVLAARRLGSSIDTLHLGWCDALFRVDAAGQLLYPSFKALFSGQLHSADAELQTQLEATLRQLSNDYGVTAQTTIYAPLGVGHHADHLLTYQAVNNVFKTVRWWEDAPYNLEATALFQRQAELQPRLITTHHLTSQEATLKHQAVTAYASQLDGLYTSGLNEVTLTTEKWYENS